MSQEATEENNKFIYGGRAGYNPVLGKNKAARIAEGSTIDISLSRSNVRDEVFRHLGIATRLLNQRRAADALNHPTDYLDNKINDELMIAEYAVDAFRGTVKFDLSLGETVEDAKAHGYQVASETYKRYMDQHNRKFPENITEKVATKLLK